MNKTKWESQLHGGGFAYGSLTRQIFGNVAKLNAKTLIPW